MAFMEGIPTVVVELDKPRTLGFTLGAMRRSMEEKKKRNLPEDAPEPLQIPIDVWACLDAQERAELSIEQIEEMIHLGNLKAVATSLRELVKLSSPAAEEGGDQTSDPPQAGPRLASQG